MVHATLRRGRRYVGLCAALVLLLLAAGTQAAQALYAVQRVVDGDTVVLETIGTVRLIGVDAPETVDPRVPVQVFGAEASAFLHQLLDGESVRLEYDQQYTDKYGRTLAYLFLPDGTFVNREIVAQGFGHAYLEFPFQRMDEFRQAEREARGGGARVVGRVTDGVSGDDGERARSGVGEHVVAGVSLSGHQVLRQHGSG